MGFSADVIGSGGGGGGDTSWKANVAAVINLPGSGNTVGDKRLVTSTGEVYYWNGAAWALIVSTAQLDFSDTYVIADWADGGDHWYLDIVHNLNKAGALAYSIYDTNTGEELIISTVDFIDNNTIQLRVPKVPDDRADITVVVENKA